MQCCLEFRNVTMGDRYAIWEEGSDTLRPNVQTREAAYF